MWYTYITKVSAYDFSDSAKERAEKLASEKGVSIQYDLYAFTEEKYEKAEFEAIAIAYVHVPASIKTQMHKRFDSYLKIGGKLIMEVFSKEHRELNKVNPAVGGPPNADMMYSIEEIKEDFPNYKIIELKVESTTLNEGFSHVGESSVLRFVGEKISP